MSQSLVIAITDGDILLATAYYKHSGSAESALSLLRLAIHEYWVWQLMNLRNHNRHKLSHRDNAVAMLGATGAGISSVECDAIHNDCSGVFEDLILPPCTDTANLILVTDNSMAEYCGYADNFATIDLLTATLQFEVGVIKSVDEYNDGILAGEYTVPLWKIPVVPHLDFGNIPLSEFNMLEDAIVNDLEGIRISDNEIVIWPEL